MALPISIEQLLSARTVESSRVEYKEGWNPDAIYRSICAFANDFDNTGGGYIVIGVEEKNGMAVRPVKGLEIEQFDSIEKSMIGFNNLIKPVFYPRTSIEDIDGKKVFVIWVTAGDRRPYEVPEQITAKEKKYNYYIRYNSSSIVAKGDILRELYDLTNKTPFDDRANDNATLNDVSKTLLRDYLVKTGSKLARTVETESIADTLLQMDLVAGPMENLHPKNVALMMFNDHPERFFPYTQIDIVIFPKGKQQDPSNFIEVPPIKGPIDRMIMDAMSYLRTNIIKENVQKLSYTEKAVRCFNYPEEAIEEAVSNTIYHRNYQTREPIEIVIEPDAIRIISYDGADRSVTMEDLRRGKTRPRRYRNRRIGDFLKELGLTEGKATGIPTIQEKLALNGSPAANFETDNERTYFMAIIPVHPQFKGHSITPNGIEDVIENVIDELPERQRVILDILKKDVIENASLLAKKTGVSWRTIMRDLNSLREKGLVKYVGPDKGGHWEIIEQ